MNQTQSLVGFMILYLVGGFGRVDSQPGTSNGYMENDPAGIQIGTRHVHTVYYLTQPQIHEDNDDRLNALAQRLGIQRDSIGNNEEYSFQVQENGQRVPENARLCGQTTLIQRTGPGTYNRIQYQRFLPVSAAPPAPQQLQQ